MTTTQRGPLHGGLSALMDMLSYRRPAFSTSEEAFIDRFIRDLPGVDEDTFGNLWVTVRAADGTVPPILWSSHTDSVHHSAGRQNVVRDGPFVRLRDPGKASKGLSNCLGADCAAGVWIMREMILAGVPGLYAFHRDEESGGRGSSWVLANTPERLEGITFAIAFDRKGYDSVITHQGSRTASDDFAVSLALILGGAFKPDDGGLFTDTAIYADVIPECSNVSVGYFGQHGPREEQDVEFLQELRDTVIAADWTRLVSSRDPKVADEWWHREDDRWAGLDFEKWDRSSTGDPFSDLTAFIRNNPAVVADFMESNGFTEDDLKAHARGAGFLN